MIIRAIPNARKFGIAFRDGRITVRVCARANENAANKELLAKLKEVTGRKVHLRKGARAREKEIAFENLADDEALALLLKMAD